MALHAEPSDESRSRHPIATELAFVVGALVALVLWEHIARTYLFPAVGLAPGGWTFEAVDSLLVSGAVTGALLLAGVVAVAAGYVAARDVAVGGALPVPGRGPEVAGAVLLPVALVVVTKLVGVLTGTAYSTLVRRSYGAEATAWHAVSMTVLTLFVAVPAAVVVCQVLVQGSFRRAVGDAEAAVLTTLVAGVLLVDPDGGTLDVLPSRGPVLGAVLFVAALAVALYGRERVERPWLRASAYLPVATIVAGTALSGVAAIDTVAGGLFVLVQFAVLGVAADSYERTESLLVPALAYAGFLATSEAVVFLLEAGVQHW